MFQHIDAAQLLALPKAAPTRLGKGTILARYVLPWLRSTTTSFGPYDGVVLLWTSFDRAPSASPLQEEGGRVALLRLSFQLPRAACAVTAIVRDARKEVEVEASEPHPHDGLRGSVAADG